MSHDEIGGETVIYGTFVERVNGQRAGPTLALTEVPHGLAQSGSLQNALLEQSRLDDGRSRGLQVVEWFQLP